MMNLLYRLLLTFNSTSLLLVVYAIKEQYTINWENINSRLDFVPDFVSYILFFFAPVLLTLISLLISKLLANDNIDQGKIAEVEQANNAFLPSYLGYFFVALSVVECETLWFIFAILFVFTFFSQTLYFNPLFLLFRYHFYYLTTSNRVKIFIITRKVLKVPTAVDLPKLKRINNFTFIDKEK